MQRKMTNPPAKSRKLTGKARAAFVAKMKAARLASGRSKPGAAPKRKNPVPLALHIIGNPPKGSAMSKRRHRKSRKHAKAKRTTRAVVVAATKAVRRKSRRRRNPGFSLAKARAFGGAAKSFGKGILGDVMALPTSIDLKNPKTFLWLGIGAGGTAVAGAYVAASAAAVIPANLVSNPWIARGVNGACYALTAVVGSRLVPDAKARRQVLAGGLGVSLAELLFPGSTSAALRQIPMVGSLIPDPAKPAAPPKPVTAKPSPKPLKDGMSELAEDLDTDDQMLATGEDAMVRSLG